MKKLRIERTFFRTTMWIFLSTVLVAVFALPAAFPADAYTGDCSDISLKNLRGAVFTDKILGKKEKAEPGVVSQSYVAENLGYMKQHGLMLVRVPFYWEAYVNSPSAFMQELELIAKTAKANGMCIVFANFHYYTTSYWGLKVEGKSGGRGFPSFVVNDFPKKTDYISTAGPFWNAFLSNNIWINGKKVWDVQFEFFAKVINKVKSYDSVVGFEILNEPHLFKKEQYDKLGNYHTYLAKKMRAITDKKIFFDRETTRGIPREPSLEYKIFPRGVSGLVYTVQLYAVPTTGSSGMKQINLFKELSQKYGTQVFICEWAADNQSEAATFLKAFKNNGFGWSYYAWRKSTGGLGGTLYDSDSTSPTQDLKDLKAAMANVY